MKFDKKRGKRGVVVRFLCALGFRCVLNVAKDEERALSKVVSTRGEECPSIYMISSQNRSKYEYQSALMFPSQNCKVLSCSPQNP